MELQLRFTEAESSLAAPDVAAFAAVDHALLREQAAEHDDGSPLADLIAAGIVASRMRMVDDEPTRARAPVFVPLRHWPIPAISAVSSERGPLALDQFVLADHAHGHFAWPQQRRRPARAGTALVLAACIPMFFPDTALAQAPGAAQPAPTTIVPPAPAPVTPPPVVVVAPPVTPPPVSAASPPIAAPTLPSMHTILSAMKGHEAVVFVAGRTITGLIIGVDGDFVMMVDADRDGKIAMIPKAKILEVRGKPGPQRLTRVPLPKQSGTGALVGGGALVGIGGPLMISGLVFVSFSASYAPLWLPQVLPAMLMLGAGIPLLVVGARRRRAYREAQQHNSLARRMMPSVGRTPGGGWTGGLSLRF